MADEVVNIDLTADELIERLKAGKIYRPDKIAAALGNFFTQDNLLQLRELALKEVALRVEKKVDSEVTGSETFRRDKLLATNRVVIGGDLTQRKFNSRKVRLGKIMYVTTGWR